MKHTRDTRLFEPIVAVKNYSRGFQSVHVSFQSTSSCNIESISALNEFTNVIELREKVRCKHKQQWVIEMNRAQKMYLATHFWIDVLDGRIQNARIFYRVWNYWHSTMNHCLAITFLPCRISTYSVVKVFFVLFGKLRIL